ncbi:MAG: DNA polymerase I [Lachnospiraceae bacterium]
MSEKIVLIDGHSILHRAFYGVPDLTNSEGLHTNAIYGFLNILFKILTEEKPEYLTVAFDNHAPTFRHEMYAPYKGTRKPMLEELRQQVPIIKEVLQAMGIKIIEQAGLEADDLLGTLCKQCEIRGMEVAVISGDRDLLQLASTCVKIRIPKTKQGKTEVEDYYASDVKERYQVSPQEFIDVKALMGDASDNIPGVPSIGEKTATKIIVEYGSIENAYAHVEEVKPPRASKALQEYYEQAQLSKTLATIEVDADIDYELTDAKLGDIYTKEAYVWFQRLQFKNLLGRFEVKTPKNKVTDGFHDIRDRKNAEIVFAEAKTKNIVGASFIKESKNVLPLFSQMTNYDGIVIAYGEGDIYHIHTGCEMDMRYLFHQLEEIARVISCFSMMNIKDVLSFLDLENRKSSFDMIIAAYLLNPLKNDYTYIDIAHEQLDLMIDYNLEDVEQACYEAYVAYAGVVPLREKLQASGMMSLYEKIEMPLVYTLFDMETAGVKVNAEALKVYGDELGTKIVELEKDIYGLAKEEFNINSPKQLGVVLFEHLELPFGKKTKTGYSTAAEVLEKLAPEYPIVSKILEYRQLTKLKSTYADGLAHCIDTDGRIHSKFNQTITATGRISSTEPNLQNIPIRMELGRLIRKVFIPEEGYQFVDADYSQIELRILAHCSGDEELIRAYKEEQDIHRITASQVFHTPFDEVTNLQRRNAKAVNFGIVYGISSFGLSQDLSITKKEATNYINTYFDTYPSIKGFLDHAVAQAKEKGHVDTLYGRQRPIPELNSGNFMQRAFGERIAMNSPIQGTAADVMKIAMIGVNEALKEGHMKSRLVLQVHDELLVEAYQEELEQVQDILRKEMEGAAQLLVPLVIDMHVGNNWYEAK